MTMQSAFPDMRSDDRAVVQSILLYRGDTVNACPGCGRSHWFVGRVMAQCACCETALPLAHGWRFEGLGRSG